MRLNCILEIIFFFIVFNSFGQSQEEFLDDSLSINFESRNLITLLKEKALLNRHNPLSIDKGLRWLFYVDKAITYHYLGEDSVFQYLDFAIEDNSKSFCKLLKSSEWWYNLRLEEEDFTSERKFFLYELPDVKIKEIRDLCGQYNFETKKGTHQLTPIVEYIMNNDQTLRLQADIDWTIQNALDLKNRMYLDSLYKEYGSFAPFNKYEQDAFSFVLHHSEDCDWNKKWFKIWLDEDIKGNLKSGKLLGMAFIRMLEPGKGVCAVRDPEGSKSFIENLKKQYPLNYAEKYGYYNY